MTLQDVLERFRLSRQCALGIAVQVLRGLHEVHAAGLIHRDVKPANIMLCRQGGEPGWESTRS